MNRFPLVVATLALGLTGTNLSAQVLGGLRAAPALRTATEMAAWDKVEGCAKRIAIAEPGHPFVTGCGDGDATQVFFLNNAGSFEPVGGAAVSVQPLLTMSSGSGGERGFTGIGADGRATPTLSVEVCVRELASGRSAADPSVTWTWVLVCPSGGARDFPIARRISNALAGGDGVMVGQMPDFSFNYYPGAAVRLAVGINDSVAWVVNSEGAIWRQNYCKGTDPDESVQVTAFCKSIPDGWEQIPGCARAIANGGSNRVWAIGCDPDGSGNASVYQYSGAGDGGPIAASRWIKRAGRGKEIAVDSEGRPWLVRADGTIWRWSGAVPGKRETLPSDPAQPKAADPR